MSNPDRTFIESLGVYLPPKEVTTDDVVKGCAKKLMLPMERLTGIVSRRVAGETEFSRDLAVKAVEDCLAMSKHGPADIDLVVCCNISRFDGPDEYSFEPGTAASLREKFGMVHALAFDITNACAGMFTGVYLADALVRAGAIRRALVVSGEYITHLSDTAQKEINALADSRVPCLTLGDAGAAVIIEASPDPAVGFHGLELFTMGRHSGLCIAKVTDQPHGGAIMKTDMIKLAELSITAFMRHAAVMAFRLGWSPAMVDHVLPHQTSKVSLGVGNRKIERVVGDRFEVENKVIDNVAHRGNTATTSHFVALKDSILNGKVKSGQVIAFGILASGITVGTAMYRLDDLPDRVRKGREGAGPAPTPRPAGQATFSRADRRPRVRIESVGLLDGAAAGPGDTIQMMAKACEKALAGSAFDRSEIELLLSTGVYRSEFLMEPALAALLAGAVRTNDAAQATDPRRTLAFDVVNSGVGPLNACYLAAELVREKNVRTVMIAASEVENNATVAPGELRGVRETASAMILGASPDGETGFGAMCFRTFPEHAKALRVYGRMRHHRVGDKWTARLFIEKDPALAGYFVAGIKETVGSLLLSVGRGTDDIDVVLPPQISPAFIGSLADALGLPRAKFVDLSAAGDLFTSSLPYGFAQLRETGLPARGKIGLFISAGAGLEIGCALYHF